MNDRPPLMDTDDNNFLPEALTDQAAAEMLALLYEIAGMLEARYAAQIWRYYHDTDPRQPDLWD